MKKLSKVLAVILAVCMMATFMNLTIFAADANEDPYACLKEGTGYVAIGDSFTRGYGASDHWQDQLYRNDDYGDFECRNVDGSYPNRIAEEFGLYAPDDIRDTDGKLWPLAHDAVSVAYILDLLGIDDGFRDDEFTYDDGSMKDRYKADLQYFGDPESYTLDGTARYGQTGEVMSVRDMLKNASLITIGLGQTDVIYKAQIFGLNTLDLSDTKSLPAGIANIGKLLFKYYDYWKDAYPMFLSYIKEINPDAKVVLVGTINPIRNATIADNVGIKIGVIINSIMDSMNNLMKDCALRFGYSYVDISDVDTPSSVETMSIGQILSITDSVEYALIAHPTPNGYKQIAERIIDTIKDEVKKDTLSDFQAFFVSVFNYFKRYFVNLFYRFNYWF